MDAFVEHMQGNSAVYLAVALGLGIVAVILSGVMSWRSYRLSRPLAQVITGSHNPSDILPAVLQRVEDNAAGLRRLTSQLEGYMYDSRTAIRKIAIVRYNAFEDIAGQQSFSLCMLDAERNGLLMTYLTGKHSTRSYAVPIAAGQAPRRLSDEEKEVLAQALGLRKPQEPAPVADPMARYDEAPAGS